jgi:ATP-dependent helicase Lhr and Lhr-like helicase
VLAATERRREVEVLFEGARFEPDHPLPPSLGKRDPPDPDETATRIVQGHLEISGPITVDELARATGLNAGHTKIALEALRGKGIAVAGNFEGDGEQWCARRLLARIHSYTRERRRAQVRPVSQQEYEAFLDAWLHTAPGTQLHGRAGVAEVIEQLQGSESPAGEWERIFAARVESYRPEWLDDLCLSGEVAWGRLSLLERAAEASEEEAEWTGKTPSRRTPITFMLRDDLPWLLQAHRGTAVPAEPATGVSHEVLQALKDRGALFHSELQSLTERLPTEIEDGLWDGVARGLLSADGFNAIRSLLHSRTRFASRQRRQNYPRAGGSRGRRGSWRHGVEGRWTLLPPVEQIEELEELAELVAWQLLHRWGVVFRDVYVKERIATPWRDILWALRRLEARGLIRGGHFITGMTGEQFAEETTIPLLRRRQAAARAAS